VWSTVGYPSDSLASCYFRSTSVFSALEVFLRECAI